MLVIQNMLNCFMWGTVTHLVELDDVRVVQHLHDLDLPVDLLQVDSIQLGLVDDLNGHLQSDGASTIQTVIRRFLNNKQMNHCYSRQTRRIRHSHTQAQPAI